MKQTFLKITALSLFAVALVAAPAAGRAGTNNPAAGAGQEAAAAHKKHEPGALPFHGKLTAVDKAAMTLTVGERTFEITSETKISKDGLPATLRDAVVGEMIGGAYKKNADGKFSATSVHIGLNSDGAPAKKKKAPAEGAGTHTNSAAR